MAKTTKKTSTRKKKSAKTTEPGTEVPVTVKSTAEAAPDRLPASWADIDRFFEDFLERRLAHPFRWNWPSLQGWPSRMEDRTPSVDIVDREKEVFVRAEVPGIDKEDIDVTLDERLLTIKGSTRHEEKKEEKNYYRHEIRSGTFARSVVLPSDVDASKAKTSFKNGVVELHLPKLSPSRRQQIKVS
jgi:HSP20 family protein